MSRRRRITVQGSTIPRRLVAVHAISNIVVAASMLSLARYYKRAATSTSASASPEHGVGSHPQPNSSLPPQPPSRARAVRRIARGVLDFSVALGTLVVIVWFGSVTTPGGLAILVGGVVALLGWGFWATHWHNRTDLLFRLWDLTRIAGLAALTAALVASTEDLYIQALVLFVAFGLFGVNLWGSELHVSGSRANLGAALLGGALVAATVFFVEATSQGQSQRHQLRFTVSLQKDLTAVDLYGEDLSYAHLYKKNLTDADLREINLTRAFLGQATLTGALLNDAILKEADLSDAVVKEASLSGATLEGANLAGANFEDADLERTRFTGVKQEDFESVDFTGASLARADLSGTSLPGSDFTEADLTRASLGGANLASVNLTGATLDAANLSGTVLEHANLRYVDLRRLDLRTAKLDEAVFTSTNWPKNLRPASTSFYVVEPRADLRKADLSGQDLTDHDLTGADLRGANVHSTKLADARLAGAKLQRLDFSRTDLRDAGFNGADLRKAILDGLDFASADLTRANLQGSSLRGADLHKARLSHADLSGARANQFTKWPRGFDPIAAGVHVIKQTYSDE
jgi:uncharacterized protein YjbI with pentapeptide repeats